jgi:hypothetical protein
MTSRTVKSYKPLVLKQEYSLKQTFGQAGTVRQPSQVGLLHRHMMMMIIIIIIAVMKWSSLPPLEQMKQNCNSI